MGTVNSAGNPPQLWTNEYLADLSTEGEIQISTEVPCIYSRSALNITGGTSIYELSQRFTGIISVTWQGFLIYPIFQTQLRNYVISNPVEGDELTPRPSFYMRLGYGINGIKFFATPSTTINYDNTNINTQEGIRNNIIVSGWCVADTTSEIYRIPNYIRETLVRYYVMKRAYAKEGKGQNLEASAYYNKKYDKLLNRFKVITSQLYSSRLHGMQEVNYYSARLPRPQLPSNFGEKV